MNHCRVNKGSEAPLGTFIADQVRNGNKIVFCLIKCQEYRTDPIISNRRPRKLVLDERTTSLSMENLLLWDISAHCKEGSITEGNYKTQHV